MSCDRNKNGASGTLGGIPERAAATKHSAEAANTLTAGPVPTSRELRSEPAPGEQGTQWTATGHVLRTEYTETARGKAAQRIFLKTDGEHPVPFYTLMRGGAAPILAGDFIELSGSLEGSLSSKSPWVRCNQVKVLTPAAAKGTAPSDALDWSAK